ncbi:MAG: winged helix-turn-helix domain-containing protein [Gammaproteobacteria bacterium]|nr:winged helix-turn-helix domain-containing protein [Gammaproteobacteria bacterium]MCB1873575.1 winged helix-turn-helix domain-containing protein [Gammaproteobacteria bacterium]
MTKTDTHNATAGSSPSTAFFVSDWRVEPDTLRIFRADSETKLEPKVMQVLVYLAERSGEVISREELEANLWTGRVVGYDSVVNTIIKLRKAFGDDSRHPQIIETIPKTGYRLISTVKRYMPEPDRPPDGREPETGRSIVSNPRRIVLSIAAVLLFLVMGTWLLQVAEHTPTNGKDPREKPSIAVLPFQNIGADPDQEYFANGFTEDLITDLSKVQGLNVVARNSVFIYRNSAQHEQTIGRELGVHYVLKGSVQRAGNQVRINIHLTGVADGRNLWAERYDRELDDIFQIQDELAARIVSAMEVELAPADRRRLSRNYVVSVEAYDEFLRGLDYYGRRSPDGSLLAKAHFSRALALDPGFVRATAGLALTYSRDWIDGWGPSALESLNHASELVERALQLDASIPQLYFVRSQVKLMQRNYAAAIDDIEKALVLNSSYADGYALMGWILHFAGRPDEALEFMQRAIRLNPRVPAIYRLVLGAIHYARGELDQAVELLRTGAEISPNYQQIRVWLAAVYAAAGQLEEAEWEAAEILVINPEFSLEAAESAFPFRDPVYRDRFIADLRKAGLAD